MFAYNDGVSLRITIIICDGTIIILWRIYGLAADRITFYKVL